MAGGQTTIPRPVPRGSQEFSFTTAMGRLCADVVARVPAVAHVDLARVAIAFAEARKRTRHGIYASLTPLRFEGGSLTTQRHGRRYTIQRLFDSQGREMLYILTFYLPRFMDLPFLEKLTTVFHELWHVSPRFDGDLRRHAGRCYAHTHSQKQYDADMERLARQYLAAAPSAAVYEFLQADLAGLVAKHGRVVGVKVRRPRLLRLD